MPVKFEMSGFDELQTKLAELGRKGSTVSGEALKQGGEIIAQDAKLRVRLGPGRYGVHVRDDIKVRKLRKRGGISYVEVGISDDNNGPAFYGRFLEYGTSRQVKRPFMRPAFEAKKGEAIRIVFAEIKNKLNL